MTMIDGQPAALINDDTALVYFCGAVHVARIEQRDDGTYTGVSLIRSFSSDSELATLRSASLSA